MSCRPVAACLFLLCLVPGLPQAQSSGGAYLLRKHAVAGGGGQASGGDYQLVSTSGQSNASVASGGGYRLVGGFHQPMGAVQPPDLFSNGFE